jgi:hypothetical protein
LEQQRLGGAILRGLSAQMVGASVNSNLDDLISFLPAGDINYVREDDGRWGVVIFDRGSVTRLMTVASGMDKGVAAWFADHLRETRKPRA